VDVDDVGADPVTGAPPGAEVGLYVDAVRQLEAGDLVLTETGRAYRVVAVRVQQRGKRTGRQHLRVVVLAEPPADEVPALTLRWYRR
jgi:hypothetical protein